MGTHQILGAQWGHRDGATCLPPPMGNPVGNPVQAGDARGWY